MYGEFALLDHFLLSVLEIDCEKSLFFFRSCEGGARTLERRSAKRHKRDNGGRKPEKYKQRLLPAHSQSK